MTLKLEALETREVPAAKLQLIHNSPFAAVGVVDVYVNNNLFLNDLPFQSATEFLDLAPATDLKIDITSGTAANNANPIATAKLNLVDNSATIGILVGQPGGSGDGAFHLATAPGRTSALTPGLVEFLAFNGSPDFGSQDIRVRGVGNLGDNLAPGAFSADYQSTIAADLVADVTSGSGGLALVSSKMALAGHAGDAAILMTSGFLNPATVNDPALTLIAVFDDGTSITFAPQVDPVYAAGSVTSEGSAAILASVNGTAVLSSIVFPGATGSARVAAADLTGDGVPELLAGSGRGTLGLLRILDGVTGVMIHEIQPFGDFLGGVNVAAGDLTGDGIADYVLSPDDGGGPRCRIFNGATHQQIADFFGIDDVNFRGGARAALGDMNHDGRADLLVSAGIGGGPRIALYDGALLTSNGGPKFVGDFFAFEEGLRNGAFITAGDIDGDGFADLIVGGGPGGGPRVRVFSGQAITANAQLETLADFFAGGEGERLGVRLAARDFDHDGRDDILAGGIPGGPVSRIFLAKDLPLSGHGIAAIAAGSFDGNAPLGEVFVG